MAARVELINKQVEDSILRAMTDPRAQAIWSPAELSKATGVTPETSVEAALERMRGAYVGTVSAPRQSGWMLTMRGAMTGQLLT